MQDLNDKATGNQITAAEWNQLPSEIQNVIEATGQTLSGTDLNQLGKGIAQYAANGDFYADSGAANAYVLTALNSKQAPAAYTDGMRVRWRPANDNTGASTVNVATLGVKTIKYNGLTLESGRLVAGKSYTMEYRTSDGFFHILLTEDITGFKINAYDIRTGAYENKSFSVSAQDVAPRGIVFKPDGTTMYMSGATAQGIYQYTLSTPWDVSTAAYASKSYTVLQDSQIKGVFFKPDGLTMYVVGAFTDTIYQYTLSTPWDVSTASYASKSFSVTTQDTAPQGVFFKSDGASMYMIGELNDTVYQYTLSTPWDVSTASYASKSFSVAGQDSGAESVFFKSDGLKMWVNGRTNDNVYQYTLSTAWDVSTAAYASIALYVGAQAANGYYMAFQSEGKLMYVLDGNANIYQYITNYVSSD